MWWLCTCQIYLITPWIKELKLLPQFQDNLSLSGHNCVLWRLVAPFQSFKFLQQNNKTWPGGCKIHYLASVRKNKKLEGKTASKTNVSFNFYTERQSSQSSSIYLRSSLSSPSSLEPISTDINDHPRWDFFVQHIRFFAFSCQLFLSYHCHQCSFSPLHIARLWKWFFCMNARKCQSCSAKKSDKQSFLQS